MKELAYKFQNPHNSCEAVYYCRETKQYYVLLPFTPYSKQLCTCSHHKGYFEADCPVRAGLSYKLGDTEVTTEENGEIIDYAKKAEFESQEKTFFRVKPEYASLPDYERFGGNRLFEQLYEYMNPEHFNRVVYRRGDVFCMMGGWYKKTECRIGGKDSI